MIGMLMLVVIIPTVCLLWFVSEAVRNERMAVQQKLTDLYRSQLESLQPMLQNFWEHKVINLSRINENLSPSERFIKMVESGIADSMLIYNEEGKLLYPQDYEFSNINLNDLGDEWKHAEQLEFKKAKYLSAAGIYAGIARDSQNIHIRGRALQSQARCLGKAGKESEIINIIAGTLSNPIYNSVRDSNGRLIVPDAQLFAIQLTSGNPVPAYHRLLGSLLTRLKNYSEPVMPSSQRLFLMRELKKIKGDIEFPTLEAEKLVSIYSQVQVLHPRQYGLTKISENGMWQIASSDMKVIAIFTQDRIERETRVFINSNVMHTGASFTFITRNSSTDSKPILRMDAGDYFPDWKLVVHVEDDDHFMAESEKQISLYIWTALLIIVGILILAIITTRLFVRQMSLARLKNDLITTVSHELKTPLASIRLLVDTLVDGKYRDENLVKEYIELIAKENERLTRLVENFLTFSRIEDKKQNFYFKVVAPEKIVRSVHDTIKHRFESGGFSFELKISEDMPDIVADYDAMVMVLLNLLDNAYHYSNSIKSVTLAAYSEDGNICFEVADKGIGLPPDQRKKILEPFYQVDQTLSRRGSGFGLGLSIVKSIVDVHHGSIEMKSEPGKGSVFTIKVPVKD